MNQKFKDATLIITLYIVMALVASFWLLNKLFSGIVCVYGPLPIETFYPFYPYFSWNTYLGTITTLVMPSHLISNLDFLPQNAAWALHEILLPIIGAVFMFSLLKKVLNFFGSQKERSYITPLAIVCGAIYELVLLSHSIDYWIMGFLAIAPAVPFFTLITLEHLLNGNQKNTIIFGLLLILFLSALDDWRAQLAGLLLVVVFSLGFIKFSSLFRLFRNRLFLILIGALCLVWSCLWFFPHIVNLAIYTLSNTRSVTLAIIVGNYNFHSTVGFITSNIFLSYLYVIIILIAIFSSVLYRNKFCIISSTLIIAIILITWDLSPLKFFHYHLTTLSIGSYDVGVFFRTGKIFSIFAFPLIFVLFALSLIKLFAFSKKTKIFGSLLTTLVCASVFVNVTVDNQAFRQVTIIPDDYGEAESWLQSNQGLYRTIWLPRTGKYNFESQLWVNTDGWGIPETSVVTQNYYLYGKPMEYLYPFLMTSLNNNQTKTVSFVCSQIGVKYLAIQNDVGPDFKNEVEQIIVNLLNSCYFKLAFSMGNIYIFENLRQQDFLSSSLVIFDGGLKSLSQFLELTNISNSFRAYFSDSILSRDIVEHTETFVARSRSNLDINLLVNLLFDSGKNEYFVIPTDFASGLTAGEWHPFYVDNPHSAEWETFYVWNLKNVTYENSFKYNWGFIGSTSVNEEQVIPLSVNQSGEYCLFARYLRSEQGGNISLAVGSKSFNIATRGCENGFEWFYTRLSLTGNNHNLTVKNLGGLNAINLFLLLPASDYSLYANELSTILAGKTLIFQGNFTTENIPISHSISVSSFSKQSSDYFLTFNTTLPVPVSINIPEQYHGGWIGEVNGEKNLNSNPELFVNNFFFVTNLSGTYNVHLTFAPQSLWGSLYIINVAFVVVILVLGIVFLFCRSLKKHIDSAFRRKIFKTIKRN